MPTLHENQLGVTAGGYSSLAKSQEDLNATTVIYASQIIESPQRRFITDTERYAIAQLQKNGMLKLSYDANEDGVVDRASKADEADRAKVATRAITADSATTATTAERANEADHANNATLADKANNADYAENANRATLADRALKADEATKANAVDWSDVYAKPDDLAMLEDITWERVKDSAPDFISDTSALENRLDNLERDSHVHVNAEQLKKISVDSENNPLWDGNRWPGSDSDMRKAVYDADDDGIVDRAKTVNYNDITDLPTKFTPEEHMHNANDITQDSNHRFVSDAMMDSWNAKAEALGYTPENIDNKGVANGYAPLDAEGMLPGKHIRDVQWEALLNKPETPVYEIDETVKKAHTHVNLDILDKLTESPEGIPVWDGKEWPYTGNMRKEDYDHDEDGVIDHAYKADTTVWSGIGGRPLSTVADIDDAVGKKHTHGNVNALNMLSVDNMQLPVWNGEQWPFDMKRSIYDTDNDGVVDEAAVARNVKWVGVLGRPNSEVVEIDEAVSKRHDHTNLLALSHISDNDTTDRLTYKGKELAFKEDTAILNTPNGDVQGKHSVEVDTEDGKLHLTNDQAFPEADSYYGTDVNMNRGWHKLPTANNYKPLNSIVIDNNNNILLKNDNPAPVANSYYGTNENGELGYHDLPDNSATMPTAGSLNADVILQDDNHRFLTKNLLEKLEAIDLDKINSIGSGGGSGTGTTTPTTDPNTITGPAALVGTRQCLISASDAFFTLNGADLYIRANKNNPIIASFSISHDEEVIKIINEDIIVRNLPSTLSDGTAYIYLYVDNDGRVKANKTDLKPIYSFNMPTEKENGRYWFNVKTYTMYVSNGSTYVLADKPTLFIGEVSAVNGKVSKVPYAIGAVYDSGWYNVSYSTTYSKNHNMGTDIVVVTAYRGTNGVNMGEFAFALNGTSSDAAPVGDRITKVTENTIQTTRYGMLAYSDVMYGTTNQHRILVRRGW